MPPRSDRTRGLIALVTKESHILSMKLNSRESLDTGSKLVREFGSWTEVRRQSRPNKHGVMVLQVKREDRERVSPQDHKVASGER
ncbi:MAG TPA: hypothetical protein DIV82_02560 [Brevundimonas diminuta]|nr:hypothetical protein [Brevundimonas diminuta]